MDIYLNEATVTPDPTDTVNGKRIATGPLATEAKQNSILAEVSTTTAAAASTAVTAGNSTTPATWLAGLAALYGATPDAAHGFLTVGATENAILIEATTAARTLALAWLDGATWRHFAAPTIPAYSRAVIPCERKVIAIGIAGGATVNATPIKA